MVTRICSIGRLCACTFRCNESRCSSERRECIPVCKYRRKISESWLVTWTLPKIHRDYDRAPRFLVASQIKNRKMEVKSRKKTKRVIRREKRWADVEKTYKYTYRNSRLDNIAVSGTIIGESLFLLFSFFLFSLFPSDFCLFLQCVHQDSKQSETELQCILRTKREQLRPQLNGTNWHRVYVDIYIVRYISNAKFSLS